MQTHRCCSMAATARRRAGALTIKTSGAIIPCWSPFTRTCLRRIVRPGDPPPVDGSIDGHGLASEGAHLGPDELPGARESLRGQGRAVRRIVVLLHPAREMPLRFQIPWSCDRAGLYSTALSPSANTSFFARDQRLTCASRWRASEMVGNSSAHIRATGGSRRVLRQAWPKPWSA